MSYDCPQCGSRQTSSFELMYERGTRSGSINAATIMFNGDVGITNGQFNSQSLLAGRLSSPLTPKMGCLVQILIGIASIILSIFISGTVMTAIDTVIGISSPNRVMALPLVLIVAFFLSGVYLYNKFSQQKRMNVYREQLKEWANSMICQRCGNMWIRQ